MAYPFWLLTISAIAQCKWEGPHRMYEETAHYSYQAYIHKAHHGDNFYFEIHLRSFPALLSCTSFRPYFQALLSGPTVMPNFHAQLSCPTFRPNFHALLSGPSFRPYFQALISGPTIRNNFQALLSGPTIRHYYSAVCVA